MWTLQTSGSGDDPLVFRLLPGAVKTVGRSAGADFIVDAALVSRVHCRLTAVDGRVEVVDLQSTNGTFINDQRVATGEMTSGDRLRVGRVELTATWAERA